MSLVIVMVMACSFLMAPIAESKDWKTEKTTIRVEAHSWMLKKLAIEDAAKKFMEMYPNVTVEVSAMQDTSLNNYLLNWSTGDIEVDLAFGGAAVEVGKLAAKDLLEPWNDFYTGDFTRDEFLTFTVELPKKGDEYFAIPSMVEAMSLQANKALMAEAGLVNADGTPMAPKNLDELYEFAKKMTKGTGDVKDVYGFSWNFTNFAESQLQCAVAALGGKSHNEDGSPNLEAPEILDIFRFIKKCTADGYCSLGTITDTNAARSGLKAGTVAMLFEAASRATEAKVDSIGDDAVILPFPNMEENGTYIFAHYAYMPRGCEVKDAVWAFMKEAVFTNEFAAFGANNYGKLPPMKRQYAELNEDFSQIQAWMANPKTIGDVPWKDGSKYQVLLYEIEQALATTDLTPEDAVKRLIAEGSKLDLKRIK
jgi:ABC-type glycerol-3-phosphate transport system substrate-binding protein